MGAAGLGIGSGAGGPSRGASARGSAGDVSSLVGNEKVVVQKREAYGEKFYRQVHAIQHLVVRTVRCTIASVDFTNAATLAECFLFFYRELVEIRVRTGTVN